MFVLRILTIKQSKFYSQCYDKAIEIYPQYAEAHYSKGTMGFAFFLSGNVNTRLDKVYLLEINPQFANVNNDESFCLDDLCCGGQSALEWLEKVIEVDPQDAGAYNTNKGRYFLHFQGKYEGALESFDRAIALNPSHALAYNNKGECLVNLYRAHVGLDNFEQAIQISPRYAEAILNKADCFSNIGG